MATNAAMTTPIHAPCSIVLCATKARMPIVEAIRSHSVTVSHTGLVPEARPYSRAVVFALSFTPVGPSGPRVFCTSWGLMPSSEAASRQGVTGTTRGDRRAYGEPVGWPATEMRQPATRHTSALGDVGDDLL